MFKEKKHRVIIIVSVVLILVLLAKIILSSIIENKIKNKINENTLKGYSTHVEKVNFNLFNKSIVLKNLKLEGTDSISSSKNNLKKISFSSLRVNGIEYYNLIFNKDVVVSDLTINDLLIETTNQKNTSKKDENKISLDSIPIDKITGLKIKKFNFNNIQYTVYDSITNKKVFHHRPVSINLDGFQLVKVQNNIFKMLPINKVFKINNIEIDVSSKDHTLFIDEIDFNTENFNATLKKFKYLTTNGKYALAKKIKYNESVMDISIDKLVFYNFSTDKYLNDEGVFIDSILISGGLFDIYKDKEKPFNKKVYKKLPHVLLKEMKSPLYINTLHIENSKLKLEENMPKTDLYLKLTLDNINGKVKNITSIKKYMKEPMTAVLKSNLLNKAEVYAKFTFPLNTKKSTFYYEGSLAKTKFSYFDKILYPALGLKVIKGNLEKLTFKVTANDYNAYGNMVMLYHDLDATVYKHKTHEKNKILSWAVTTVLHNSNPVKNKKVRVAEIYRVREKFRGFGGYLWRTMQSGIVNTLSPAGNKTSRKAEEIRLKKERKARKGKLK